MWTSRKRTCCSSTPVNQWATLRRQRTLQIVVRSFDGRSAAESTILNGPACVTLAAVRADDDTLPHPCEAGFYVRYVEIFQQAGVEPNSPQRVRELVSEWNRMLTGDASGRTTVPFNPIAEPLGGCYTCRYFGHRMGGSTIRCAKPEHEHVRSQAENGCAFWQREPGTDD